MTQPGGGEPLNKITLTDNDGTSYNLILDGGDKSIVETFLSPNPFVSGGTGRYGDFEPGFGFIEQRDWSRGFGSEEFSEDQSRFYDGDNLWSATPNVLAPQLKWRWWDPGVVKDSNYSEFDNIDFGSAVVGGTIEYSTSFVPAANYDAKHVFFWVLGPNTGSCDTYARIYSDSGGTPDTLLGTSASVTQASYAGVYEPKLLRFTFASAVSLTSGTTYHIVFYANGTGVGGQYVPGGQTGSSGGTYSLNGFSTSTAYKTLWFRITEGNYARRFVPFILQNALYAVAIYSNASASKLYINGDRGKATAGASTTLTDSNEGLRGAWTTDQWAGASVWITAGTGKGQVRTISSNDTNGVLTVDTAWNTNPSTDSFYVIVNTDDWAEIDSGGTGLGVVTSVAVANDVAYAAEGFGGNIRRFNWNSAGSPPAMQYADDSTNDADVLAVANGYIWRGTNDDGKIAKAPIQSWGTDLTFTDMDNDTGFDFNFTNIIGHGQFVFIFKENSVWYCDPNTTELFEYPVNVAYMPSPENGVAVATKEEYLYFNWAWAIERLSGLTVDHLDPNRGGGMPENRQGAVTCMAPHPAGMFFGVDAGKAGYSSVCIFDDTGFHEAFRYPVVSQSVTSLLWQSVPGLQPILWIGVGDELVYQKYPLNHSNPLKDTNCVFMHQFSLYTSTLDMNAKGLKKLFKEVEVIFKDNSSATVYLFYQKDGDIGSTTWTYIGTLSATGSIDFADSGFLAGLNTLGNIRELRLKFLIRHTDGDAPPQIKAYTVKGFGRTPTKKQWSLAVSVSETMEQLGSGDPTTLMAWIDTKAENAEALLMTSEHQRLHNKNVLIIPRSLRTFWIDYNNESFLGVTYLELREA